MKIIEPKSMYLTTKGVHPYQFMEKVGRICYKSEKNITEDSAVKFITGLKKSNHTAMLEHSHIILNVDSELASKLIHTLYTSSISDNNNYSPAIKYFNITNLGSTYIISGSFRSFLSLVNIDDESIKYVLSSLHTKYPELFSVVKPIKNTELITIFDSTDEFIKYVRKLSNINDLNTVLSKHITHTVVFTCDRGVTHEFVRHRPASFAQESTRYCNYSKDKYGNEITVIKPCFFEKDSKEYEIWKNSCECAEKAYLELLNLGCSAQQARDVLPTSVKTELVITATEEEWQHIINLRYHGTTGAPHPQIVQSMTMCYNDLIKHSNNRLK